MARTFDMTDPGQHEECLAEAARQSILYGSLYLMFNEPGGAVTIHDARDVRIQASGEAAAP